MANPSSHLRAPDETHDEHPHGVGRYLVVWIALLCGTVLTVVTGHMDLGSVNLPLALTIASIKAILVIAFFMHMTEAPAANRIVFIVSVFFALLLIVGVFGDLLTRNAMSLPSSAPSTLGPEIQVPGGPSPEHGHE